MHHRYRGRLSLPSRLAEPVAAGAAVLGADVGGAGADCSSSSKSNKLTSLGLGGAGVGLLVAAGADGREEGRETLLRLPPVLSSSSPASYSSKLSRRMVEPPEPPPVL